MITMNLILLDFLCFASAAAAADDDWDSLFDKVPVLPCRPFSHEYLTSWASLGPNYGVSSQIINELKR